jgi:hypothetical protein
MFSPAARLKYFNVQPEENKPKFIQAFFSTLSNLKLRIELDQARSKNVAHEACGEMLFKLEENEPPQASVTIISIVMYPFS